MPSTRAERARRWLLAALAPIAEGLAPAAVGLSQLALVVLLLTGEALRWSDYGDTWLSIAMLRAIHITAGFALAAALLVRVAQGLARLTRAAWRRFRGSITPAGGGTRRTPGVAGAVRALVAWLRAYPADGRSRAARWLDAAWWLVVALLLVSGANRYLVLRPEAGWAPLGTAAAGWAVHRAALPYLYTILLLNGLTWSRLALRRALAYLHTP